MVFSKYLIHIHWIGKGEKNKIFVKFFLFKFKFFIVTSSITYFACGLFFVKLFTVIWCMALIRPILSLPLSYKIYNKYSFISTYKYICTRWIISLFYYYFHSRFDEQIISNKIISSIPAFRRFDFPISDFRRYRQIENLYRDSSALLLHNIICVHAKCTIYYLLYLALILQRNEYLIIRALFVDTHKCTKKTSDILQYEYNMKILTDCTTEKNEWSGKRT